jgi:hypothetical protein
VSEHDDLLYLVYIDDSAGLVERTVTGRGPQGCHPLPAPNSRGVHTTALPSVQGLPPGDPLGSGRRIPKNRVVHGYLDVNLDIVWAIVEHDLPLLAECVRAELSVRNQRGRSGPA